MPLGDRGESFRGLLAPSIPLLPVLIIILFIVPVFVSIAATGYTPEEMASPSDGLVPGETLSDGYITVNFYENNITYNQQSCTVSVHTNMSCYRYVDITHLEVQPSLFRSSTWWIEYDSRSSNIKYNISIMFPEESVLYKDVDVFLVDFSTLNDHTPVLFLGPSGSAPIITWTEDDVSGRAYINYGDYGIAVLTQFFALGDAVKLPKSITADSDITDTSVAGVSMEGNHTIGIVYSLYIYGNNKEGISPTNNNTPSNEYTAEEIYTVTEEFVITTGNKNCSSLLPIIERTDSDYDSNMSLDIQTEEDMDISVTGPLYEFSESDVIVTINISYNRPSPEDGENIFYSLYPVRIHHTGVTPIWLSPPTYDNTPYSVSISGLSYQTTVILEGSINEDGGHISLKADTESDVWILVAIPSDMELNITTDGDISTLSWGGPGLRFYNILLHCKSPIPLEVHLSVNNASSEDGSDEIPESQENSVDTDEPIPKDNAVDANPDSDSSIDGGIGTGSDESPSLTPQNPNPMPEQGVVVSVIVVGTVAAAAFAASTEYGRYKFLSLLPLLPMYSRIDRDNVLENLTRKAIYEYIARNPGQNLSLIMNELNIARGTLIYHINVLKREELILARRDGRKVRFYPTGWGTHSHELSWLEYLIIQELMAGGSMRLKEISRKLDKSSQVIHYHLRNLISKGYVSKERKGHIALYKLTDKAHELSLEPQM